MGCGSAVEDVAEVGGDIAAAATGNAELIPLINAGVTTAGGVAQGESIGKAAGQGAIAGGEALAGQELAGAVGVGTGNDAFNNALGITGDNPAGTGLPDIGGAVNNAIGSVGGGGTADAATTPGGAPANASGTAAATPTTPTASTPLSGGGGTVSPGNVSDFSSNQINSLLSTGQSTAPATLPSTAPVTGAAADSALGSASTDQIGSITPAPSTLPSTAPTTTASAPTSGGLLNTIEQTGIKAALPLAGVAYSALKGPAQLPGSSTQLEAGGAATAPLLGLEQQGATEAQTGQLTAPQQASILQGVQQQQNALIQQLVNEGVTNIQGDSRYIQGMQQIQQWAQAQQQQYIQAAINEATSAGGAASSNIATVANQQIQQDQDYQNALSQALAALGASVGGGGISVKA